MTDRRTVRSNIKIRWLIITSSILPKPKYFVRLPFISWDQTSIIFDSHHVGPSLHPTVPKNPSITMVDDGLRENLTEIGPQGFREI